MRLRVSVPFQEMPHYNEKRRMTMTSTYGSLQRSRSNPSLHMLFMHDSSATASPLPSTRSANPGYALSSNGTWSGGRGGGGDYDSDSPRSMSICSTGSVTGEATMTSHLQHRLSDR